MTTYYIYKANVPLLPGQTLAYTPGKGYYAAGTPAPNAAQIAKNETVQPVVVQPKPAAVALSSPSAQPATAERVGGIAVDQAISVANAATGTTPPSSTASASATINADVGGLSVKQATAIADAAIGVDAPTSQSPAGQVGKNTQVPSYVDQPVAPSITQVAPAAAQPSPAGSRVLASTVQPVGGGLPPGAPELPPGTPQTTLYYQYRDDVRPNRDLGQSVGYEPGKGYYIITPPAALLLPRDIFPGNTIYYTHSVDAHRQPWQTLHYTPGKGYYVTPAGGPPPYYTLAASLGPNHVYAFASASNVVTDLGEFATHGKSDSDALGDYASAGVGSLQARVAGTVLRDTTNGATFVSVDLHLDTHNVPEGDDLVPSFWVAIGNAEFPNLPVRWVNINPPNEINLHVNLDEPGQVTSGPRQVQLTGAEYVAGVRAGYFLLDENNVEVVTAGGKAFGVQNLYQWFAAPQVTAYGNAYPPVSAGSETRPVVQPKPARPFVQPLGGG
jgi:hypothetical protein